MAGGRELISASLGHEVFGYAFGYRHQFGQTTANYAKLQV